MSGTWHSGQHIVTSWLHWLSPLWLMGILPEASLHSIPSRSHCPWEEVSHIELSFPKHVSSCIFFYFPYNNLKNQEDVAGNSPVTQLYLWKWSLFLCRSLWDLRIGYNILFFFHWDFIELYENVYIRNFCLELRFLETNATTWKLL